MSGLRRGGRKHRRGNAGCSGNGGGLTMETPTDVSRTPGRGLPASDVMFILGIAFIVIALVVTIAVRHS
jgi:hypothetical protein